jgi:Circularly permutated YpsA SLOG family/Domain of unknown function (DUF6794)
MAMLLDKIISGGQTGADRAALDFAIKHKIPHGGWAPKGRIAEDGPLPKKYKLTESPTTSYQRRTEQNVIGSDGTLIVSHGRLTGGSAYTRTMAKKHNRPCLHLDLNKSDIFQLSMLLLEWIDEYEIKALNVAGPMASKDPKVYRLVKEVLEVWLMLESRRDRIFDSFQLNKSSTKKDIKRPTTVEEAVDRLMSEMKLKDLAKLANMVSDDLINLHFTVGMWIRNNFVYPRNDKLLESCREVSKNKYLHNAQMHMVIVRELWKRLQETHKLKVVK